MRHSAAGQRRFERDSIDDTVGRGWGRVLGFGMQMATSGCKTLGEGGNAIVCLLIVGTGSSLKILVRNLNGRHWGCVRTS